MLWKWRILGIFFLWMGLVTGWERPVVAAETVSEDATSAEQAQWYIARAGGIHGPYTESRMDDFIDDGTVTSTTLVRASNWDKWLRADDAFDAFKQKEPAAPDIVWQPSDVTMDDAVQIRPRITSAKHLAALGVSLWSVGKLLQVIGVAVVVNHISVNFGEDETDDDSGMAGVVVFMVGSGVGLLSPIPSVVAENRVNRILQQTGYGRLGNKKRLVSAGVFYGVGVGLAAAGVGGMFTKIGAMSLWALLAAEISLAFANFSALHRIRRFERRNFRGLTVIPQIRKGLVGLSVGTTF